MRLTQLNNNNDQRKIIIGEEPNRGTVRVVRISGIYFQPYIRCIGNIREGKKGKGKKSIVHVTDNGSEVSNFVLYYGYINTNYAMVFILCDTVSLA